MGKKNSSDGPAGAIGWSIFAVIVVIAMIPKEVWITLGVVLGTGLLIWGIYAAVEAYSKSRAAAEEQARIEQAAQVAAEKKSRVERARALKQQRIASMGTTNAALVESARASVKEVAATEAARSGWLGDVDFTADIQAITDNFQKAHSLSKIADKLVVLDNPSDDDRKILAEANTTVADLESTACQRVELIRKCSQEAHRIDASLRQERDDARTAEQRAELHGKLSAMLYGIEATPDTTPADSAADAVLARVQAYLEIKNQIQQARDNEFL